MRDVSQFFPSVSSVPGAQVSVNLRLRQPLGKLIVSNRPIGFGTNQTTSANGVSANPVGVGKFYARIVLVSSLWATQTFVLLFCAKIDRKGNHRETRQTKNQLPQESS